MNILILQGSPRANGNTAWMDEEYRKAAEAVVALRGSDPIGGVRVVELIDSAMKGEVRIVP